MFHAALLHVAAGETSLKEVLRVIPRDPVDAADRLQVTTMTNTFRGAYDLRQVFAESAVYCMGN